MAESFFSDALGDEHEYHADFLDRLALVAMAKTGSTGGDIKCRKQGDSGPYSAIYHTQAQVKQVLLDMDKAQLG